MYHYVRCNKKEGTPQLHSLDIEKFKQQLDWLESEFELLTYDELLFLQKNKKPVGKNRYLLTFDDGLMDHYRYVYPELKKRNLEGLFFLNSQPYIEKRPLDVHMTHFISEKIGPHHFFNEAVEILKRENVSLESHHSTDRYIYDTESYLKLKKMMNYQLDYSFREKMLEEIFLKYFDDFQSFIGGIYLSQKNIHEMAEGGMIFGNHTHSHKVLSRLSVEEQKNEIDKCQDFLSSLISQKNIPFCYPYGHDFTYTEDTKRIITNRGINIAFVNVKGTMKLEVDHGLELKRYNTNELPPLKTFEEKELVI